MGRFQNIQAINLLNICDTDPHLSDLQDLIPQHPAAGIRKLLGIKDSGQLPFPGQYDCCGNNRTCKRSPARFINPGDKSKPLLKELSFPEEEFIVISQI